MERNDLVSASANIFVYLTTIFRSKRYQEGEKCYILRQGKFLSAVLFRSFTPTRKVSFNHHTWRLVSGICCSFDSYSDTPDMGDFRLSTQLFRTVMDKA